MRNEGRPFLGGDPTVPIGHSSSFADLLRRMGPPDPVAPGGDPAGRPTFPTAGPTGMNPAEPPHGTTVLALKYDEGVVIAGDRRATEGHSIADRAMEKVYAADDYSAIGIAGAAGQALEMVRLFQTELEHYEKVEGEHLSLEGKANRLAQLVRQNFTLALQGLVVVPIFAGFDLHRGEGRIFRYDVIGGRYEETEYNATGSGSRDARGSMKKRWRAGLDRAEAIAVAVEGLFDAADEDTATGGPDAMRGIYPRVFVITAEGVQAIPEQEVVEAFDRVLTLRSEPQHRPTATDAAGPEAEETS